MSVIEDFSSFRLSSFTSHARAREMMNIFLFSFLMMSINASSTFKVDFSRPSVLVAIAG